MRHVAFVLLCGVTACRHSNRDLAELSRDERAWTMQQHFQDVFVAWDALLRGDVAAARESGVRLLNAYQTLPADSDRVSHASSATVEAIAELAYANDLASAAHAVARVGARCGECHAASRAEVVLPAITIPPSPDPTDVRAVMTHHRAATAAMWRGLIMGDDPAFQTAVNTLATGTLLPDGVGVDSPLPPEARALERTVQEAAARAVAASDPDARANAFGDMMTSCAACHKLLHGGPNAPLAYPANVPVGVEDLAPTQ